MKIKELQIECQELQDRVDILTAENEELEAANEKLKQEAEDLDYQIYELKMEAQANNWLRYHINANDLDIASADWLNTYIHDYCKSRGIRMEEHK